MKFTPNEVEVTICRVETLVMCKRFFNDRLRDPWTNLISPENAAELLIYFAAGSENFEKCAKVLKESNAIITDMRHDGKWMLVTYNFKEGEIGFIYPR